MAEQHQSHTITFQHEQQEVYDPNARAKMVLDQEGGWNDFTGYMSEANFARYIGMLLYGEDFYEPLMDCGIDGGRLVTVIQAYPFSNSLQFNLHTSYGDLGLGALEYPEVTTLVSFSKSDSATVSYPIYGIVSREWLGQVYDTNNNAVSDPSVVYSGDEIKLNKQVYGSLEITYKTKRFDYLLVVEPRENTESYETKYDTYVWATYSGGLTWLKVSEPPNSDDLAGGAPCGYSYNYEFNIGKEPPANPPPKDKEIEMDYCLLEEKDDGEGLV